MKKLLDKNSLPLGAIATLLSELLCALLLWLILLVAGIPVTEHLRWFAVAFVPPALLLRYYAHRKDFPDTLKAVIVTLFITVVLFMWWMLKYQHLTI